MLKRFVFMTGASQYRIHAANREEAIQHAFSALNPGENTKAVILNTMRDEQESQKYFAEEPKAEAAPTEPAPRPEPRTWPSEPGMASVICMAARSR